MVDIKIDSHNASGYVDIIGNPFEVCTEMCIMLSHIVNRYPDGARLLTIAMLGANKGTQDNAFDDVAKLYLETRLQEMKPTT